MCKLLLRLEEGVRVRRAEVEGKYAVRNVAARAGA